MVLTGLVFLSAAQAVLRQEEQKHADLRLTLEGLTATSQKTADIVDRVRHSISYTDTTPRREQSR